MFNKFELDKHGEERVQKIKINHGKTEYFRREKFCEEHGWIDLFMIGGDLKWQEKHGSCRETELEFSALPEIEGNLIQKAA